MSFCFSKLREVLDRLADIERRLSDMPTRAEFDAAKAQLKQAVADAASRVSADIQALRNQLAAGNPLTDADLADVQADVQALGAIDPAPAPSP